MVDRPNRVTVGICDTQPVTAEGVRAVLAASPEMEFRWAVSSLEDASHMLNSDPTTIILADKALGVNGLFHWIANMRTVSNAAVVVWGSSLTEAEALRFIQAGARGVVRKVVKPETLTACLRAAGKGCAWMEDIIFRTAPRMIRQSHSGLTPRESQVFGLVEQGLTNGEIARELGIRPGTVKIHLKHLYEKTGLRGRYHLALSGLREKGILTMTA
jgi:two-component system nitrate/nitrite response regulator NarL